MNRNSVLNDRHRALGSKLDGDTWNCMPIPWSYHTDPHDEVVAVRTRAGLYDVTALNIVNVSGPDAETVLNNERLVLWDAHSIRSVVPRFFEGELPHLNIGSADDQSCDPALTAVLA